MKPNKHRQPCPRLRLCLCLGRNSGLVLFFPAPCRGDQSLDKIAGAGRFLVLEGRTETGVASAVSLRLQGLPITHPRENNTDHWEAKRGETERQRQRWRSRVGFGWPSGLRLCLSRFCISLFTLPDSRTSRPPDSLSLTLLLSPLPLFTLASRRRCCSWPAKACRRQRQRQSRWMLRPWRSRTCCATAHRIAEFTFSHPPKHAICPLIPISTHMGNASPTRNPRLVPCPTDTVAAPASPFALPLNLAWAGPRSSRWQQTRTGSSLVAILKAPSNFPRLLRSPGIQSQAGTVLSPTPLPLAGWLAAGQVFSRAFLPTVSSWTNVSSATHASHEELQKVRCRVQLKICVSTTAVPLMRRHPPLACRDHVPLACFRPL